MKARKLQLGFSLPELMLAIVFLTAIGLIAWSVYDRQQDKANLLSNDPLPTAATTATNVVNAPEIDSTDDLDKALQTLDQNDPSSTNSADSKQLDTSAGNL